jgi:hypothetical protein
MFNVITILYKNSNTFRLLSEHVNEKLFKFNLKIELEIKQLFKFTSKRVYKK